MIVTMYDHENKYIIILKDTGIAGKIMANLQLI